jgi:hypothetical protein
MAGMYAGEEPLYRQVATFWRRRLLRLHCLLRQVVVPCQPLLSESDQVGGAPRSDPFMIFK